MILTIKNIETKGYRKHPNFNIWFKQNTFGNSFYVRCECGRFLDEMKGKLKNELEVECPYCKLKTRFPAVLKEKIMWTEEEVGIQWQKRKV